MLKLGDTKKEKYGLSTYGQFPGKQDWCDHFSFSSDCSHSLGFLLYLSDTKVRSIYFNMATVITSTKHCILFSGVYSRKFCLCFLDVVNKASRLSIEDFFLINYRIGWIGVLYFFSPPITFPNREMAVHDMALTRLDFTVLWK